MLTCDICGKKFFTSCMQNWPYRYGSKIFCSEDCRIVHAARDLHRIDFCTIPDGGSTEEMAERREKRMAKSKALLTEDQRKVVNEALNGGNPLKILKEQGQKNPSAAWVFIKKKLKDKEPETYQKLMEMQPVEPLIRKLKEDGKLPVKKAEVQVAKKLPEEAKVTKVAQLPEPVENLTIPGIEVLRFKVTGIETDHGKFYYDEKSGQFRWMPKDSTVVVMMQADEWMKMAADLPEILAVLGVQKK